MAVFKCKICGGSLDITDGSSIAVCDYCGTKQTISTTKDDVVANLFNRANNLRLKCEFDKAEQVYEKILDINNTDAEAHWGMVLCKYGIEYVEDKKTDSKIPTCHRTLYEAILTDVDYLATIENADTAQKELYEAEALVIDGLQKNILNIVNNEEPFDVFICYKETDEAGKRTIDSSIANDIYYHLTQEGFKVFYAPITLENKLGYEYEPYIFAALNSAKVMLVVGTKPEHFDAVWVRNEWSRYLKLMKSERSKLLIPCYKDMDAYELPDEFAHLQAQDMSKIGFIQDLLRGINKLISSSKPQSTIVKETVVHNADSNITPLLKRVFIFLEDEDWNNAEEYCEKVLDINPECAEAYIGKLMVELKVKTRNSLKNCKEAFENNSNYQKAIRFGDEEIRSELRDAISTIKKRNEEERLHQAYTTAVMQMGSATTEADYKAIAALFVKIQNYKDSKLKADECLRKIEELKRKAEEALLRETRRREEEKLEQERQKELKRIEREKVRKRNKKLASIITPIVVIVIAFITVLFTVIIPNSKYNAAVALMNDGNYQEAISAFELLDGYKDSNVQIENCYERIDDNIYQEALKLYNSENYEMAKQLFETISAHKDSASLAKQCDNILFQKVYKEAEIYLQNNDWFKAATLFYSIKDYSDAKTRCFAIWQENLPQSTVCTNNMTIHAHTFAVTNDGKVLATGDLSPSLGRNISAVKNWSDIVAVSAKGHVMGLKKDGTVVATGSNSTGQLDVGTWKDIVRIAAGSGSFGIKSDGTVISTEYIALEDGWEAYNYGQNDVDSWSDIVYISASETHTVGLKADGTVVAVGHNNKGQCDVESWNDIVFIAAEDGMVTYGVKADGTVVKTQNGQDVSSWQNIKNISIGSHHVVGLKNDGTIATTSRSVSGESDLVKLKNVVSVVAGDSYTVALKTNGTLSAVGTDHADERMNVKTWSNIKMP